MKALFANGPVPGVQPEKKIVWNTERIKWWLANGAQPSETVVKLLEKVGRPTVFPHRYLIPLKPTIDCNHRGCGRVSESLQLLNSNRRLFFLAMRTGRSSDWQP
jgi:hypothetical protein